MNVEHINPVLTGIKHVIQMVCQVEVTTGKLHISPGIYPEETLVISVGITGQLRGQAIFVFSKNVACNLASRMMMGMPVTELNDMTKSALAELANMTMGNAMTNYSTQGILLDITPPMVYAGRDLDFSVSDMKLIAIPIIVDEENTFIFNIAIGEKK
mgnify:CR=1 FL=1